MVVIGGGCIGATTAIMLAEAGLGVTLLEKDKIGDGATHAAGGGLNYLSDDFSGAGLFSFNQRSVSSLKEFKCLLEDRSGLEIEQYDDAILQIAFTPEELAALRLRASDLWSAGASKSDIYELSSAELLERAPYLNRDVVGGFIAQEGQINTADLRHAYKNTLASYENIAVLEQATAVEINSDASYDHTVTYETAAGTGQIRCQWVVVAAGVFSLELLPITGAVMKPVKGQMYLMDTGMRETVNNDRPFSYHIYSHSSNAYDEAGREYTAYVLPRKNGQVVAGVTYEPEAGFDESVTDAVHARMHAANVSMVPELKDARIVHRWCGFRPAVIENDDYAMPLIGELSERPGIVIAAGHLGLGITMSAGTGSLVRNIVQQKLSKDDQSTLANTSPNRLTS